MNEGIPKISNVIIDPEDVAIRTWAELEKTNFNSWLPSVAGYFQCCIYTSIAAYLIKHGSAKKATSLVLPWGTFTSNVTDKVSDIEWTMSKNFDKLLNGDSDLLNKSTRNYQTDFDDEFTEMMNDVLTENEYSFGKSDSSASGEPAKVDKGINLQNCEVSYFLNSYLVMLATVAKEKEHDGKEYTLPITGFGEYRFDYDDGHITPHFIPSKEFKQKMKCDEFIALNQEDNDVA